MASSMSLTAQLGFSETPHHAVIVNEQRNVPSSSKASRRKQNIRQSIREDDGAFASSNIIGSPKKMHQTPSVIYPAQNVQLHKSQGKKEKDSIQKIAKQAPKMANNLHSVSGVKSKKHIGKPSKKGIGQEEEICEFLIDKPGMTEFVVLQSLTDLDHVDLDKPIAVTHYTQPPEFNVLTTWPKNWDMYNITTILKEFQRQNNFSAKPCKAFLPVLCETLEAVLHLDKFFCPGYNRQCLEYQGRLISPKQINELAKVEHRRAWKQSLVISTDGNHGRKVVRISHLFKAELLDFTNHDIFCTGRCISRMNDKNVQHYFDSKMKKKKKKKKAGGKPAAKRPRLDFEETHTSNQDFVIEYDNCEDDQNLDNSQEEDMYDE